MDAGLNYLAHSLPVGIIHWLDATAVICMILRGWQIYNASPLLPSTFRQWMTLS
jgi:thiosulfate reductase cytochrome b subunit